MHMMLDRGRVEHVFPRPPLAAGSSAPASGCSSRTERALQRTWTLPELIQIGPARTFLLKVSSLSGPRTTRTTSDPAAAAPRTSMELPEYIVRISTVAGASVSEPGAACPAPKVCEPAQNSVSRTASFLISHLLSGTTLGSEDSLPPSAARCRPRSAWNPRSAGGRARLRPRDSAGWPGC